MMMTTFLPHLFISSPYTQKSHLIKWHATQSSFQRFGNSDQQKVYLKCRWKKLSSLWPHLGVLQKMCWMYWKVYSSFYQWLRIFEDFNDIDRVNNLSLWRFLKLQKRSKQFYSYFANSEVWWFLDNRRFREF